MNQKYLNINKDLTKDLILVLQTGLELKLCMREEILGLIVIY